MPRNRLIGLEGAVDDVDVRRVGENEGGRLADSHLRAGQDLSGVVRTCLVVERHDDFSNVVARTAKR